MLDDNTPNAELPVM